MGFAERLKKLDKTLKKKKERKKVEKEKQKGRQYVFNIKLVI